MNIPVHGTVRHGESDVLPMINLVLLLLVFFMLFGTLAAGRPLSEPFPVQPPTSVSAGRAAAQTDVLLITADGRIAFGGAPIEPSELPARAATWRTTHPDAPLRVAADAQLDAAAFVALLERLRAAGIAHVGLAALPAQR